MQLVGEDEEGEETLTIDSITSQESSPIIKLADSIVFNAIQRRASDIHIETRDNEVVVKYRIDGVLYEALDPIDKRHHSTIISRIKVMSELDIAEKRVPQDGRFKLRVTGRTIDFRVSIIPSAHGEDAVIRILDKESMNKEFKNLRLDVLGRFLNMKVDLYNFVSALNCVLAQRLVRKICQECKRQVRYPEAFLIESGLNPAEYRDELFSEGAGCLECNGTGFHGRSAIAELLDLSDRIRGMILDRRPASEIKKAAKEEGMAFLRESALKKVTEGRTTLREINKVTFVE